MAKATNPAQTRPTDHAVTDSEVIFKMRDAYLAKAAADPTNDPVAAEAIRAHFDQMNATLRALEKERAEAEPRQLEALLQFAARAYRRPLTDAERADLLAYYHQDRTQNQLSHEEALRNAITSVLMEPDFLYRLDMTEPQTASVQSRVPRRVLHTSTAIPSEPLSSYALASRLSYFLWASMPDEELLRHAAANDLQKPAVLLAQARRMMKDPRVRGLATEFTGNWLAFRLLKPTTRSIASAFPSSTTICGKPCSRNPSATSKTPFRTIVPCSTLSMAITHSSTQCWPNTTAYRESRVTATTGCASTMPGNMEGAVCCPCRYS